MKDELLRQQINDLIRDELQQNINEYVDEKERVKTPEGFGGFVAPEDKDSELKVNIPENEVDKILREYKKIKRKEKSNFSQIKKLVDKNGRPL